MSTTKIHALSNQKETSTTEEEYGKDLNGKTVLVTGASSGIGEQAARIFASRGMNVIVTARRKDRLDQIVSEINKEGKGRAIAVAVDVSNEEDQKKAFQEGEKEFGQINFVLANAGVAGGLENFIEDEDSIKKAETIFKTNVIGTLITLKYGVKELRKAGGGAIAVTSSAAGAVSPMEDILPSVTNIGWIYGPSKSAIDQIVRNSASLAKDNIRVYSVAPHLFRTDIVDKTLAGLGKTQEDFAFHANPIYPGKPGDPKDLANVFLTLFDNTTTYKPGDLFYCDNDATYHADTRYQNLYHHESGKHYIDLSQVRDLRGNLGFQVKK
jgi:NAD(P)-dependent dehydrogenase (short-subunit alcohol dehydrogenase family)